MAEPNTYCGKTDKEQYHCKHCSSWRLLVIDHCDEDTEIRKQCEGVLKEFDIYGDSYGVPTLGDIVEKLIEKINESKK